jgi:hypothetical protein
MTDAADTPVELTDEMVAAKWDEIAPLIDVITARIQNPDEFVVAPTSRLAVDDIASSPYQLSHCARWCLTAGVDHLHALKSLVIDARMIHSAAPYSLVRGALENFAAGFWVLHPSEQSDRVEHALRWWAKNFKDQDKATKGLPDYQPLELKLQKLVKAGQVVRCDPKRIRNGYFSSPVLEYADKHSSAINPYAYVAWQVCSGFAHGRPWANLGMNEMETHSTDNGVALIRLTSDHKRILAVTLPAFHLMTDLVRLYQERSQGSA